MSDFEAWNAFRRGENPTVQTTLPCVGCDRLTTEQDSVEGDFGDLGRKAYTGWTGTEFPEITVGTQCKRCAEENIGPETITREFHTQEEAAAFREGVELVDIDSSLSASTMIAPFTHPRSTIWIVTLEDNRG